jgi:hypothetical protein
VTRPPDTRSPALQGGAGNHDAVVNFPKGKDSPASRSAQCFPDHRQAALALLNGDHRFTRKAGQFLGQLSVDPAPMSEAQADWLAKLLDKHGLTSLARLDGQ